mgnify:FL=1
MLTDLLPGLTFFADWRDLVLAVAGILVIILLAIWWRQQSRYWHRVLLLTFLAAFLLAFLSLYFFVVSPYYVGCPGGCPGWRGYPLPIARITVAGQTEVGLLDYGLNALLIWVVVLLLGLIARIVGNLLDWEQRARRPRAAVLLLLFAVPWAMLPRYLEPPQPTPSGEELRLVNNARRAAEATYGVTGLWVQRLALEDVRQLSPNPLVEENPNLAGVRSQVCLRGYTYFYLPWRRYRISLEPTGVTALGLAELPLDGSCWQ